MVFKITFTILNITHVEHSQSDKYINGLVDIQEKAELYCKYGTFSSLVHFLKTLL